MVSIFFKTHTHTETPFYGFALLANVRLPGTLQDWPRKTVGFKMGAIYRLSINPALVTWVVFVTFHFLKYS